MRHEKGWMKRKASDWLRAYPFVGIFVCTACIILCAYYTHYPFNPLSDTEADYLDSLAVYRVQVLEPPAVRNHSVQTDVLLLSMYRGDSVRRLNQEAVLYLRTDSLLPELQVGDIILAYTRMTRPQPVFDGEFNYGQYLRLQHKTGLGYVSPDRWKIIGHAPVRRLKAYAGVLQHRLAERYVLAGMHDRPLALVSALTLGEREGLDKDLRRSFAAAGAAHVLAVSGVHLRHTVGIANPVWMASTIVRRTRQTRAAQSDSSIADVGVCFSYRFVTLGDAGGSGTHHHPGRLGVPS